MTSAGGVDGSRKCPIIFVVSTAIASGTIGLESTRRTLRHQAGTGRGGLGGGQSRLSAASCSGPWALAPLPHVLKLSSEANPRSIRCGRKRRLLA